MNLTNKNGEKLRFNAIGKNGNKYVAYYFYKDHQLSFNVKFLGIEPSTRKNKKYAASFQIGGINNTELKEPVIKKVHFGDKRYEDFTQHKDEERKKRYVQRHKNDNLENPLSPGSLSMFILWEKPSLEEGIKFYKKHFKI
jgi:hypothetical protein